MRKVLIITGNIGDSWVKAVCTIVKNILAKSKVLIVLEENFTRRLVDELKKNDIPLSENPKLGHVAVRSPSISKLEEFALKIYNSYKFDVLMYIYRPRQGVDGLYYDSGCRVVEDLIPLEGMAYLIKSSKRNVTIIGIAGSVYHIGASKLKCDEDTCVELRDVPVDKAIFEPNPKRLSMIIRGLRL